MKKREWIGGIGLTLLIAVLFFSAVAVVGAQPVTIGWQASGSGSQCGTVTTGLDWDIINADPNKNHIYSWTMTNPIEIDFGGDNIATIDGLSIGIKADPRINFGFAASAGQSDTHFLFTSDVLLVNPALTNAQGTASASVTIGFPGDILTGNYGTKAYRAVYNGSQIFTDLVDTPVYYPGGSEFVPSTSISGQVSSMQAMWDVTISGGGSASGSSQFRILGDTIPEPASILLLGLGASALLRKHRL